MHTARGCNRALPRAAQMTAIGFDGGARTPADQPAVGTHPPHQYPPSSDELGPWPSPPGQRGCVSQGSGKTSQPAPVRPRAQHARERQVGEYLRHVLHGNVLVIQTHFLQALGIELGPMRAPARGDQFALLRARS